MNQYKTNVIKRYNNRKLYHTGLSRYVKLSEIAELVRNKQEVFVFDPENRDVTGLILTSILHQENSLPLNTLINLIQTSGVL